MNLVAVLAVYAAISAELGVPLRFPGRPGAYHALLELTDAGLLAEATVWAATEPRAGGQAFNIANGDLFRWSRMWPAVADSFGIEVAPPAADVAGRRDGRQGTGGGRDGGPARPGRDAVLGRLRVGRSGTPCSAGTTTCSATRRRPAGSDSTPRRDRTDAPGAVRRPAATPNHPVIRRLRA